MGNNGTNRENNVFMIKTCDVCEEEWGMNLTAEEAKALEKHKKREGLLQDLLPDINDTEREFLKSGYCPKCQELLFGMVPPSERIKHVNWWDPDDLD